MLRSVLFAVALVFTTAPSFADVTEYGTTAPVDAQWLQKEVKGTFFSSRSFYSCDYVEAQAKAMAKALGGRDVQVICHGGLPYDNFNSVTIRLTSAQTGVLQAGIPVEKAAFTQVKISGREACDMHDFLIRRLSKIFVVQNAKLSGACWDSQGNYRYEMEVLK